MGIALPSGAIGIKNQLLGCCRKGSAVEGDSGIGGGEKERVRCDVLFVWSPWAFRMEIYLTLTFVSKLHGFCRLCYLPSTCILHKYIQASGCRQRSGTMVL